MPLASEILGFSNRWYPLGMATAQPVKLEECEIRLATPPCFLATKCEAFVGRGGGDFLLPPDMEDMVNLLDGRTELIGEIAAAPPELRAYLQAIFRNWAGKGIFKKRLRAICCPMRFLKAELPSSNRAWSKSPNWNLIITPCDRR